MLEILPIIDENEKEKVFSSVNLPVPKCKVFFALIENGKIIGGADLSIGDISHIKSIAVIPEEQNKGNGDFFTRALIFKLQSVSDEVVIDYENDYFLRFGFKKTDGKMTAKKDEIYFPHDCKKE